MIIHWSRLFKPTLADKDKARQQFILNILLVGAIFLSFIGFIKNLLTWIQSLPAYAEGSGLPPYATFGFFLFFVFLFYLSKKGYIRVSAFILIFFLYVITFLTLIYWGADVPQGILTCALIIVMSGILLGTKYAFWWSGVICISLVIVSYIQVSHIFMPHALWKKYPLEMGDSVVSVATLGIIAMISWLFNHEIEKALRRAKESEFALLNERDHLEITVEQRTVALRKMQMEKMVQVYRFAEFGKLASGIFHDLATPLTLVSLNINKLLSIQDKSVKKEQLSEIKIALDQANLGIKRLEEFLALARKQIQNNEFEEIFSITDEIQQTLQVLSYKTYEKNVTIDFDTKEKMQIYGNPIKFHQIMTNVIANAIDSYPPARSLKSKRRIEITAKREKNAVQIMVSDNGKGIKKEHLSKIFDPFFTTKGVRGTGIGLSISKDIIERSFHGEMKVSSQSDKGTQVFITLSLKKERKRKVI